MTSRNTSRRVVASGLALALLAGGAIALSGCKKAPPPPPPPPPPKQTPPPPPPKVDFEALGRELKVDLRVAASPDIDVNDVAFAKAALHLADAIARGDNVKAGGLMARRAKTVLDELVSTGAWGAQTKGIERVRVLYADAPRGSGGMERDAAVEQIMKEAEREVERFRKGLERKGYSTEDIQRMTEAFAEETIKAAANLKFAGAADSLGDERPSMVLLLAVQDASGSYLLGWTGIKNGDTWAFNNASTLGMTRARAEDWDGIGMLGFSLGTGQAALPAGEAPATPPAPGPAGAPGKPGGA